MTKPSQIQSPSPSQPKSDARRRQRWILPFLALLFLGPLLAAWIFYFAGGGWRPGGQVNHGRLLSPVVAISTHNEAGDTQATAPWFRDAWSLVTVGQGLCEQQCIDVLDKTRRVRLALRQKAPRVRRALLYKPAQRQEKITAGQFTGVALISVADNPGRSLLDEFSEAGGAQAPAWSVFIVDPLGNVVMVFEPQFEMRGMLADLKRLLRLSRIG